LLKIGKSDAPVWQPGLFGFVDSGSSKGHRRYSMRDFFFGQATSDRGIGRNHDKTKGLCQWLQDLIARKMKSKESRAKTRVYVNCINSIVGYINRPWPMYLYAA
jgi:hypothetical protein